MQRIVLIKQQYHTTGGAERFVERAIHALTQAPLRIALISRQWDVNPGLEVIPCRSFYLGRTWRDWAFSRCTQRRIAQMRNSLVQSHERIPGCQLYRAGDGVHREWLIQRARYLGRFQQLTSRLSVYHRYVLRAERLMYADPALKAVVCNSNMVRDELRRHYDVPISKLHTIYNSVDSQRFSPSMRLKQRREARETWRFSQHALVAAFVGSGYARKGLATALRAVARAGIDVYLIVAGKDRQMQYYVRLAEKLNIADRVRFLGPLPDVRPVYAAADVLVLPTFYDPFANVVLEAMACALPVITSTTCGAVDIIQPGKNGYLRDALDHEGVAADLAALRDVPVREQIGAAARDAVLPFTDQALVEQLRDLYQRLLATSCDR